MADNNTLPPVPFNDAVLNQNGRLSPAFSNFFRVLWLRVGGPRALTNIELEALQGIELGAVNTAIAELQATNDAQAALISSIRSDVDGLNQGPVL